MDSISKAEKRKRVEKAANQRTPLPFAAPVSFYRPPQNPHTLPDLVISPRDDETDAAHVLINMHRSPTIAFTPINGPANSPILPERAGILKPARTLNNHQKITRTIPSPAANEPKSRFISLPGKELKPMDLRVRFLSIGTKAGNEALAAEYTMASPRSTFYIKAPYGLPPIGNFTPPPLITRTGPTSGVFSSTGGIAPMPLPVNDTASRTLEAINRERAIQDLSVDEREDEYRRQCNEIFRLVREVQTDAERIAGEVRHIFGAR